MIPESESEPVAAETPSARAPAMRPRSHDGGAPARNRLRSILEPFGVDASASFPLGGATCLERSCNRRALLGELVCPVHFGLATPEEIPDYLSDASARSRRVVRGATTALLLAVAGLAIGAWIGDPRFGWLGGMGAGLVLTAGLARELRFHRLAGALGLLGFLVASILVVAGALVTTIAALPWLLSKLPL